MLRSAQPNYIKMSNLGFYRQNSKFIFVVQENISNDFSLLITHML